MKKLKLDIEQLAVESFVSSGVRDGRGTVHGHSAYNGDSCACTVIANVCYPNSNIMDCIDQGSARTCDGCPLEA